MSCYETVAIHPETGKMEKVVMVDDYFGQHLYGVSFDDGQVFEVHKVKRVSTVQLWDQLEAAKRHVLSPDEIKVLHKVVEFYNRNQSFNTDPSDTHEAQCAELEERLTT